MTDYLIGADQNIPEGLIENSIPGEVETAVKSWFAVLGASFQVW